MPTSSVSCTKWFIVILSNPPTAAVIFMVVFVTIWEADVTYVMWLSFLTISINQLSSVLYDLLWYFNNIFKSAVSYVIWFICLFWQYLQSIWQLCDMIYLSILTICPRYPSVIWYGWLCNFYSIPTQAVRCLIWFIALSWLYAHISQQ